MSSAECSRVLSLLRSVSLTSVEMSSVVTGVKEAGFAAKDETTLLDCSIECLSGSHGRPVATHSGARTSLQSWETVQHFLPASVWETMKQGTMSNVIDFVLKLGLRNPSEPTAQVISLCVLWASEGHDKACAMQAEVKLSFHQQVKQMFKTKAKFLLPPVEWMQALPRTPLELKQKNPTVYEVVYSQEGPAETPISELHFQQLKGTSRMRGLRKGFSTSCLSIPATPQAIGSPQQQQQQQLMALGLQFMNEMQRRQGSHQDDVPMQIFGKPQPTRSLPPALQAAVMPTSAAASSTPRLHIVAKAFADDAVEQHVPEQQMAVDAQQGSGEVATPLKKSSVVGSVTDEILGRLAARTEEAKAIKANEKANAKGKAKAKGKTKAKAKPAPKAVVGVKKLTIKKEENTKSLSTIPPRPPHRQHPPIHYLSCTIYTDTSKKVWRAIEHSNRRKDMKYAWSKDDAWDRCLAWCRQAAKDHTYGPKGYILEIIVFESQRAYA